MTKNSIIYKILIPFISFITIIFFIINIIISIYYRNSILNNKFDKLNTQANSIAIIAANYSDSPEKENLSNLKLAVDSMSTLFSIDIFLSDNLEYIYLLSDNIQNLYLVGKQYRSDYLSQLKNNKETIILKNEFEKNQ